MLEDPTVVGLSPLGEPGGRFTLKMMLARYFIELPLPRAVVERTLLRDPEGWVPGIANEASERGDALLAEVGFGTERRVTHKVALSFGLPMVLESKTLVPIRWTPTGAQGLFPSLDADLDVAALGPDRTQLSINARYQPPFGSLGKAVDRALLHRVAEATLKDFLDGLGDAIAAEASGRSAATGGDSDDDGAQGRIPSAT